MEQVKLSAQTQQYIEKTTKKIEKKYEDTKKYLDDMISDLKQNNKIKRSLIEDLKDEARATKANDD